MLAPQRHVGLEAVSFAHRALGSFWRPTVSTVSHECRVEQPISYPPLSRSDKLQQHESSTAHLQSNQESLLRAATSTTVVDVIRSYYCWWESLHRCIALYVFPDEKGIAHTTNFAGLQSLCILLGNETLPTLKSSTSIKTDNGVYSHVHNYSGEVKVMLNTCSDNIIIMGGYKYNNKHVVNVLRCIMHSRAYN